MRSTCEFVLLNASIRSAKEMSMMAGLGDFRESTRLNDVVLVERSLAQYMRKSTVG